MKGCFYYLLQFLSKVRMYLHLAYFLNKFSFHSIFVTDLFFFYGISEAKFHDIKTKTDF